MMIIKNKTNQVQEISVMTRDNTSLTYSLYVKAKGEIDVDDSLVILNLKSLLAKGIVSTINAVVAIPSVEIPTEEVEEIVEETLEVVDIPEVEYEFPEPEETTHSEDKFSTVKETPTTTDEVEVTPEVVEADDKIFCEVCGKEFASQRSLTLHMNKSHKE